MINRRRIAAVTLGIVVCAIVVAAQSPESFSFREANIHQGSVSQPLAVPQGDTQTGTVARFLRSRGLDVATETLVPSGDPIRAANGITVVRLEQTVSGLTVYGVYAKAAFNERGELTYLIENLLPRTSAIVGNPGVSESQALNTVIGRHYPDLTDRPALARRSGPTAFFQRGAFFHAEPWVTRVAVPQEDGTLRPGLLVETWSEKQNLLHHTLVGSGGAVLDVELRTASDSYNVFVEDPLKAGQMIVSGPSSSPGSSTGWLFGGLQNTINISGNNVTAYLDTDGNNIPDAGGAPVQDGNFLAAADFGMAPSTATNRAVAVQNLFYLNNTVHDILYLHGFNESAGNFQQTNSGGGGLGNDPVQAEAQDGSGTDNANFSTPTDGGAPRMQIYLWHGPEPDHEVAVTSGFTYGAHGAEFGPALTTTGVTGDIVLVDDRRGVTSDGCERIRGSLAGKIALIDRGTCTFVKKVLNAQSAGAIGVIIANDVDDTFFTMGGTEPRIQIPAVMVGKDTGEALRSGNPGGAIRKVVNPPLLLDAALDADIVFHEYGHGLTWRMIGNMSGPIAGALGEGSSDVVAFLINGDDAIGEYSTGNVNGIRRDPYTNYPRTYRDVDGGEVHNDGEIYGAIMWRMRQGFLDEGVSVDTLFNYFVDGMNFTPPKPTFENMRDGMLQSAANAGGAHTCLIWDAFAQFGVGVGSRGTVRGQSVKIVESFVVPPQCR
ncbi:MAG TPA: M36 family metallopeptidase [Terriglobia bacterium]|nr:M36 family metallopeptidase [Terriglobia bacterium]